MTFTQAAARHLDDARLLRGLDRLPNADHLAGLAAECLLKVVAIGALGATVVPNKAPVLEGTKLEHLPSLWGVVSSSLAGRSATAFTPLLAAMNPFTEWRVEQRYDDGSHITPERVDRHLRVAGMLDYVVEEARVSGILP